MNVLAARQRCTAPTSRCESNGGVSNPQAPAFCAFGMSLVGVLLTARTRPGIVLPSDTRASKALKGAITTSEERQERAALAETDSATMPCDKSSALMVLSACSVQP